MKIKHSEIEVGEEIPFENCKLGRRKYAEALTRIVGGYSDGFVLAINSEWGTGKTTFIRMWQQELKINDFQTLYFNAWENDFDTNPLVAIMSELNTLTKAKTKQTFKELLVKGAVITKNVLPQLLKAVTSKYIDSEVIQDAIKDGVEGTVAILEDEIKGYAEKKKGLVDFRNHLEKFVKASTNEKPLIFIIDELDRCRPNYSVEVLEQVKHFFSVPGIVFVLSIDKTQLGHAVRGVYGSDRINADEYLRRFIDVEYTLPDPHPEDFCKYLFEYFDFSPFFSREVRKGSSGLASDKDSFLAFSSALFEKANLSLRQQEKVYIHTRIGLTFFEKRDLIFPELFVVLVYLKNFNREFYDKMKSMPVPIQDLLDGIAAFLPYHLDHLKHKSLTLQALLVLMHNNVLGLNQDDLVTDTEDGRLASYLTVTKSQKVNQLFYRHLRSFVNNGETRHLNLKNLIAKVDLTDEVS